jgi:hypothetical protein
MRAAIQTRALAFLIALSASTVAGQQTTTVPQRDQVSGRQTGTGVIRGRVVASDTNARGAFSITGLLPGSYKLEGQDPFGKERASVDVKVGATDVAGVILTMSTGANARGQIRFEGGTVPRDLKPSQVMLFGFADDELSGGQLPSPPVRSDWTFEVTGLYGRQVLDDGANRDWRVKTVSVAGSDFTDIPIDFSNGDVTGIEIVLSNRQTEVTGG